MPLQTGIHADHTLMQASGAFTIFEAADLKAELLAALGKADAALEIDLSGVEEVDSSGMQLLIMLKREAVRTHKRLIYSHHSPSIISLIELMELGEYLGDPMLILNPA